MQYLKKHQDSLRKANMKIVHLLSGGLDSVTLLHQYHQEGHQLHCLGFNYQQHHLRELEFARYHCELLGVPLTEWCLPYLGGLSDESWIVPNRNAIMISLAVNLSCALKFDFVMIGCNQGDAEYFPDCRPEFLKAMNGAIKGAGLPVNILAPFLDWPKGKILALASEMRIRVDKIWTCYRGGQTPCGTCPACLKLAEATK